jgi:CRP-like cAMP-binding protein
MAPHSDFADTANSGVSDNTDTPSGEELAARLLTAPTALTQLSAEQARVVVSYMEPAHFSAGTRFIREGDATDTGFMALVIRGEVIVENIVVSSTSPDTTAVLGAGSLIGEVGLLDSGPRSASCTAATELFCAILTREAFKSLLENEPAIGAKLLLAVSTRIAERLRDTVRKLRLYAKLAQAMQLEINRVM